MMIEAKEEFRIRCGTGWHGDKDRKFTFDTEQEATAVAKEFKENPRSHNPKMTDDQVAYWKSKTYVVERVFTILEEVCEV